MITLVSLRCKNPDFEYDHGTGLFEVVPQYKEIFFPTLMDLGIGIGCVLAGALTQWTFSQLVLGIGVTNAAAGVIVFASII